MAAMQSGTNEPPSISFSLAISPLVFARTPFNGDGDKPQITVTAPSQHRHNFTCKDAATVLYHPATRGALHGDERVQTGISPALDWPGRV
ncbi:hypothetical protein LMH87_006375 [Akanthomyces muscarius]|uniref:Uncharacterized protein n=1 Tax=Akanthomyces muscarius TaxID=2231603 RepID=A0A9W8QNN5_AKAMU|nr:hypothetical protein LMH87_006375 [Akanthomyces muscarius]KAJ4164713.1 hypothetical protein LMH87_006375 [Akanthomyces muscarius]